MAKSTRTTITEVARRAEVSLSTVSRVMNGNPTVDPALAERVRIIAAELGYTANPLARSLVLGRTQTVAVVVPDLGNPTFQTVLRGISAAAAADGFHVLVADSAEHVADEAAIASATRRRTDGVILCAPRMPQAELDGLLPALAPVVVVNRPAQVAAPTVAADYEVGMHQLLCHLLELGHRRIAYLSGTVASASGAARRRAIDRVLDGRPDVEIVEITAGVDVDSGAAALDAVLAASVTAALGFNDLVALGLLSAALERGLSIPRDLSIAGFDDIPYARFTTPSLTTVAVPALELGGDAWGAMTALLDGSDAPASVVREPAVVVRSSTGTAPA